MSFDFFNEGIKKDLAPVFTNQENQFLQSKLSFLDPKKTSAIPIGTALEFLKYSGLRSDRIQKILKNCNVEAGKKVITYEQMKKIFRGVALAQNNEQPSTININANIKTKMPIFYDEDSDEENPPQPQKPTKDKSQDKPEPQKQVKQERHLSNTNNFFPPPQAVKPPPPSFQKSAFTQFPPLNPHPTQPNIQTNIQSSTNYNQQPITQNPKVVPQQSQMSVKLKQFDVKWNRLKTEGNKIDGGEVKNLCKKLSERSSLSKAWKVCCLTHAGYLTKGQFFVFLDLITSNKIPESLTGEMKSIIALIDKPVTNVKQKKESLPQTPPVVMTPPNSFTQLASSHLFQNFGKSESSGPDKKQRPVQRGSLKSEQMVQKMRDKIDIYRKSEEGSDTSRQLIELKRGHQMMNNLLGQVQQFLGAVMNRNQAIKGQVEELKHGQQILNERLNKVCIAMNGVIMKQNSLIEDLVTGLASQNNMNQQRVVMLQNHIASIQQQLQMKESQLSQLGNHRTSPKQETVENKVVIQQKQQVANVKHIISPQEATHPPSPQTQIQSPPRSTQNHEQKQRVNVAKEAAPEDNQYQQRMKVKRAQVLQLIMYLTPLSPEQMPALNQRISQYSEEQLNMVYVNCYQKLQARQQAVHQQAERAAQARHESLPKDPHDDFSTSNFAGQPPPAEDMFS